MTCDIFSNWHRRFGHLNFKDLDVMMKENRITGAKLKGAPMQNLHIWQVCYRPVSKMP
jgi:hypothetical protein